MKLRLFSPRFLHALESTRWFITFAILFRVGLEISYRGFVSPVFEYAGFVLDVEYLKYFESWLIWMILVAAFPKLLLKASDYLMAYLLFSFLTPLLIFYGLSNADREHLYIVLLGVILIMLFRAGRPFGLPFIRHGRVLAYAIAALSTAAVTGWMIMSGGLNYFNLDLTRVYEFRRDVGEVINQGPMGYVNVWATKVFGPTLLTVSLWKKKYWFAFLIFCLHIVWFGISSHKSVLFYPFLIIFLWFWFGSSKALALVPMGMAGVVLLSFLAYFFYEDTLLGSLLIRRVFFVPSSLTFTYYEFFSLNEFVYWSSSITSSFISYPYQLSPAAEIGAYLGTDANGNNSFLATGYMHAGIPGVILYGILVGLLFRLIDSLSNKGVPPWVAVASLIIPTQSLLVSADLPTALLTHGVGMSIAILFLLRSADPQSDAPRDSAFRNQKRFPPLQSH
jgi:hypothetical protein